MKIKIIFSFGIIGLILFLFFLGLNNTNQYETKDLIGKKISKFELQSFNNTNKITRDIISKNIFTLNNFWASWCAPWRSEHKFLMLLMNNNKIQIVGVNFKDNKKNALKFLKELGNPYTFLTKDKDGRSSITFGIYGIPESILVDKNFVIVKKFIGPLDNEDYKKILNIIEKK
jgi:cytochrome c biogenesis protein CcmG/thiol:disulfide interchange protein DsbE